MGDLLMSGRDRGLHVAELMLAVGLAATLLSSCSQSSKAPATSLVPDEPSTTAEVQSTTTTSTTTTTTTTTAITTTMPPPPPTSPPTTRRAYVPPPPPPTAPLRANCDAAYPDFGIPPPPPDLNCPDVGRHNFTVRQPDPHRFDADHDGIGCEA